MAWKQPLHESMDWNTSPTNATHHQNRTERTYSEVVGTSFSREWNFYHIKADLVQYFYEKRLKDFSSRAWIDVISSDKDLKVKSRPTYTETKKYVEEEINKIEKEVEQIYSNVGYVNIPFALQKNQNLSELMKTWIDQLSSSDVYLYYEHKYDLVKIFSPSKTTANIQRDKLKKKLEEFEQSQKKEFEMQTTTNGIYPSLKPVKGNHSSRSSGTDSEHKHFDPLHSPVNVRPKSSYHPSPGRGHSGVDPFKAHTVKFTTPEGLEVYLRQLSIVDVQVDAIVNAANEDLRHEGGVALAIATDAGEELQRECRDFFRNGNSLAVTENVVTKAGNLPCKRVIHAVGPKWKNYWGREEECLKDLSDTVENVLETAACKSLKTIALPAISAGIYGVPQPLCAAMYVRAIMKFSKKDKLKMPRKIVIVDITTNILDEVKDAYRKWKIDPKSVKPSELIHQYNKLAQAHTPKRHNFSGSQSSSHGPNVDTKQNKYKDRSNTANLSRKTIWTQQPVETIPGLQSSVNVFEGDDGFFTLKLYNGSITKEQKVCAIVCISDTVLSGRGPLSEAIAKEGGSRYQKSFREMQSKNYMKCKAGDVFYCDSGDLRSKHVIHAVMDQVIDTAHHKLQQYRDNICKIFQKANEWRMNGISLPLLGSGFVEKSKTDLEKLCKAFYDAIVDYWQGSGNHTSLREIHLVNRNPDVTKCLVNYFERQATPADVTTTRRKTPSDSESFQNNPARSFQRSHSYENKGARPKSSSSVHHLHKDDHMEERDVKKKARDGNKFSNSQRGKSEKVSYQNLQALGIDDFENDMGSKDYQQKPRGNLNILQDDMPPSDNSHDVNPQRQQTKNEKFKAKDSSVIDNKVCCGCKNELDKTNKNSLPCGHSFCFFCFVPMQKNLICSQCNKGSSEAAATQREENTPSPVEEHIYSNDADNICVICMDEIKDIMALKCGHKFCRDCIGMSFKHKPVCPVCGQIFGALEGDQPSNGKMRIHYHKNQSLPGYDKCGTIEIKYSFPDGKQEANHPHPGQRYKGTERRGFLPMNPEGEMVLKLLQIAFRRKLTFTIGSSRTTGEENVVTWNDIHHKTKRDTGAARFGYPDPTYLTRVQDELAAKGITKDLLEDYSDEDL